MSYQKKVDIACEKVPYWNSQKIKKEASKAAKEIFGKNKSVLRNEAIKTILSMKEIDRRTLENYAHVTTVAEGKLADFNDWLKAHDEGLRLLTYHDPSVVAATVSSIAIGEIVRLREQPDELFAQLSSLRVLIQPSFAKFSEDTEKYRVFVMGVGYVSEIVLEWQDKGYFSVKRAKIYYND
ncbi:hypothetical protein [Oceaniferula spumae]